MHIYLYNTQKTNIVSLKLSVNLTFKFQYDKKYKYNIKFKYILLVFSRV